MFGIGVPELLLILVLALIIFGPGKLPEVGKAIGRGLSEFRKASKDVQQALEESPELEKKAEKPALEDKASEKSKA